MTVYLRLCALSLESLFKLVPSIFLATLPDVVINVFIWMNFQADSILNNLLPCGTNKTIQLVIHFPE